MKILIAVPCMDQVPALFAQCLTTLKKAGECVVMFNLGSLIYSSRDTLATKAITSEADFVLWLDSDMVFSPDTLENMLATMEARQDIDILTGLYFRRTTPYTPVLFEKLDIDADEKCTYKEFDEIPGELFEVAACGFGCVLMRAEIFLDVQSRFGQMFAPIGRTGEDVAFCWRARQCGARIYCDPKIELGHVGYTVINRAFYESFHSIPEVKDGNNRQR